MEMKAPAVERPAGVFVLSGPSSRTPAGALALQLSERFLEVVQKAPTASVASLVDELEGLAG